MCVLEGNTAPGTNILFSDSTLHSEQVNSSELGTEPYLREPSRAHFGAAAAGVGPDGGEGGGGAVVVRDSDGQVQVEHCVPPPARHIYRLPRALRRTIFRGLKSGGTMTVLYALLVFIGLCTVGAW